METTGVYIQGTKPSAALLVEAVDISAIQHAYEMVYDPAGGTAGTGSVDVTVNGGHGHHIRPRRRDFAYPNFVYHQINFGDFNSNDRWITFTLERRRVWQRRTSHRTTTRHFRPHGNQQSDYRRLVHADRHRGQLNMRAPMRWTTGKSIPPTVPHVYRANGLTNTFAQNIIDSPDGWQFEATVKVVEPLPELNTVMMRVTDNLGDPDAAGMINSRCLG